MDAALRSQEGRGGQAKQACEALGEMRAVCKASLMGGDLTAEEFDLVCEQSSFSYMQEIGDRFAPGIMTPLTRAGTPMIRTGKQGGAGELLSLADQQRIDACFRRRLDELGSDLDYDAIATPAS